MKKNGKQKLNTKENNPLFESKRDYFLYECGKCLLKEHEKMKKENKNKPIVVANIDMEVPADSAKLLFGEKVNSDFIDKKKASIFLTSDHEGKLAYVDLVSLDKKKRFSYDVVKKEIARNGKPIDMMALPKKHNDTLILVIEDMNEDGAAVEKRYKERKKYYADGSVAVSMDEPVTGFKKKLDDFFLNLNQDVNKDKIIKIALHFHGFKGKKSEFNRVIVKDADKFRYIEHCLTNIIPISKGKTFIFENLSCFQSDMFVTDKESKTMSFSRGKYKLLGNTGHLSKFLQNFALEAGCKIFLEERAPKDVLGCRYTLPTNRFVHVSSSSYREFDATKLNPKWVKLNQYEKNNLVGGSFAGYGWDGKVMHKGEAKMNTASGKEDNKGKGA